MDKLLHDAEKSQESSEAGEQTAFLYYDSEPRRRRRLSWIEACMLLLLLVSVILNILTYISRAREDLNDVCSVYTSQSLSPVQQDTKIKYSTVQFNGSFSNPNSSAFRLPPGKEVDDAWFSLGVQNHHYIVPEGMEHHYGLSSDHAKVLPELGGGYPVLFEFAHHLHCLNLLRQSSHWAYEHYKAEGKGVFGHNEAEVHQHVNHCTDILRQALMCQPDTGVFGQYWVRGEDGEPHSVFVDFNTEHKCKNFDEIRDWAASHQVDPKKYRSLEVGLRPGDKILDSIP